MFSTRQYNHWTDKEVQYLKSSYLLKTDKQMSEEFLATRTPSVIADKRRSLNLKKTQAPVKKWSDEDTKILKENYPFNTVNELANKFLPNKTVSQIKDKAHRIKLTKSKWTDQELDTLVEVGGKYKSNFISEVYLPNKTPEQIRGKLKNIGIKYRETQKLISQRKDRLKRLERENRQKLFHDFIKMNREQGKKFREIAELANKSESYVCQFYKKYKNKFQARICPEAGY